MVIGVVVYTIPNEFGTVEIYSFLPVSTEPCKFWSFLYECLLGLLFLGLESGSRYLIVLVPRTIVLDWWRHSWQMLSHRDRSQSIERENSPYPEGPKLISLTFPARIDGNWAMWSSWGACSKSCDEGEHRRTRICNNPVPSNGGKACIGERIDVSTCLNRRCKSGKNIIHCVSHSWVSGFRFNWLSEKTQNAYLSPQLFKTLNVDKVWTMAMLRPIWRELPSS